MNIKDYYNLFTLILKLFKAQDAHQGYTSGCYIDVVQDFVVWPITEVNHWNDLGWACPFESVSGDMGCVLLRRVKSRSMINFSI